MLNFIATDLQLYKIFKIMRVSVFGSQCRPKSHCVPKMRLAQSYTRMDGFNKIQKKI